MAAWDDVPAAGGLGECSALVRSAEALRFSAPELAVQLARRALAVGGAESALAGGADQLDQARALSMRAHAVLTAGLVRVSHYIDAVEPAFAALTLAEGGGVAELATSVRIDLAACAREVGEPLLGCALLRPVLETPQPRLSVRAMALVRLVGCTAHVGRRDDVEDALAEADRLLASDDSLSPDARRMERARLSVRAAAYHRWYGDTEDAVDAAREGIGQLNRLHGRRPETDRLRAQLVLELVCSLLDEGELGEAESASVALLAEPVRATSAAAIGQLMIAVSTRIHLPSGRVHRGRGLLDQAVWVAERHGLDGLLADALTVVCQLDEHAGRTGDALESLRAARSAEQRRLRATAKAARQILAVVGAAADWDVEAANALLHQVARQYVHPVAVSSIPPQPAATTETDEATGLPNRDGLFRRLRSVRNGERPVALTLVRLAENGTRSGINLTDLVGRVRDLAPDDAELARSDGTELAVLLPHTTRDQAEEFAQSVRETAIESDWLSQANATGISTGVGQSSPDAPSVDARALLSAARQALTPAEPARRPGERTQPVRATALTAEALAELEDVGDTLRIGRSIISSLSIPSGSGGKRRADTGTHPTLPPDPTTPPESSSSQPPPEPESESAVAHESARPVGETGGYRPLLPFSQEAEPAGAETAQERDHEAARGAPGPSDQQSVDAGNPDGYSSSYEETRAELARLMSALESGSVPDAPRAEPPASQPVPDPGPPGTSVGESGARWSFGPRDSALLPAPTRPGDDYPRNGTPSPSQSIPTPPEPSEVPEPPRRPEVPEPDEPDPIPIPPPEPPPDPGPVPPDEPGPTPLSSAEQSAAARRERRAELSSDSTTIAGLLAEALVAYQESTQDDDTRDDLRDVTRDDHRANTRDNHRVDARDDHRDNPPNYLGPAAGEEFESFDRLFDWRHQSPASGRHRSPE